MNIDHVITIIVAVLSTWQEIRHRINHNTHFPKLKQKYQLCKECQEEEDLKNKLKQ